MKKLMVLLIVGLLVVGVSAVYAAGEDSDTVTSGVSLVIPHAAKLVISDADSSLTLVQDGSAEEAFEADYTEMPANYPKLKVSANRNWQLSAKVTTPFVAVDGYTKAVSDLQLKHTNTTYVVDGFNSFVSLSSTVDQAICSSAVGIKNEWVNCQYGIILDYAKDRPGTYTATVTYTLATTA
ncbi:MAG: hypothetical protein KKD11_01040 [Candidatus Omnitrophica bacterium]|nr:hypothetical protein [Candidatus Omnitrophota bacterium]